MTRRALFAVATALFLSSVAQSSAHDELRFVGTVVRMDGAKNVLTMAYREGTKDERVDMTLTEKTTITRDKKDVPRSELRPNVTVVVDALGDHEGGVEAVSIRIVPPIKR